MDVRAGLATVLNNVADVTRQQERICAVYDAASGRQLVLRGGRRADARVQRLSEHLQSLGAIAAAERWVQEMRATGAGLG